MAQQKSSGCAGCLTIIGGLFVLGVLANMLGGKSGSGGSGGGAPAAASHITGAYMDWVPVDEKHGYALITLTNTGSTTEYAKCTVQVRNDFGNFGFDYLTGEPVPAGQTITRKLPLSVGEGSFSINSGSVTNC